LENKDSSWAKCPKCQGTGKKRRKPPKKLRLNYLKALNEFEKGSQKSIAPVPPKGELYSCPNCSGSGLVTSSHHPLPDTENYPQVAIIGGGIGGVALAVACLHRGIPFTLYERDSNFNARSQGYGLTLQQASKALKGLGISKLKQGVVSKRHLVHATDGKVIGEWGHRKWMNSDKKKPSKRTNIHIARQSLRSELLEQLGGHDMVKWGHQLIDFKTSANESIDLRFEVNGEIKHAKADLLVGADGIRSTVRRLSIGKDLSPLRYLNCIVILGICNLEDLTGVNNPLLDSATVFQTANGNERIYMMPFNKDSVMWQLSFPMLEQDAKTLSAKGTKALKDEAFKRANWHAPIPQILAATKEAQISGYPVYDRELLRSELLENLGPVTLLGDAAHPMSPFKGQGANQALLDALSLAREISKGCRSFSQWKKSGLRNCVLTSFESEMLVRSASKVKDSAEAAQFLHSKIVLHESNAPRGSILKGKDV
jgi:2-polyprenyl-6-methoxyphenol hydroxylase-like FAD-dependent oxidoreductase